MANEATSKQKKCDAYAVVLAILSQRFHGGLNFTRKQGAKKKEVRQRDSEMVMAIQEREKDDGAHLPFVTQPHTTQPARSCAATT